MDYGQWCTVGGKRYMILDADAETVAVYDSAYADTLTKGVARYPLSSVSEVSDFMLTDEERKALGYAF